MIAPSPRSRLVHSLAEPSRQPSEPRGLPLVGHLLHLARDPLGFVLRASRTHGDLIRLHLRGRPMYILNHPDLVEQVLLTEARKFRRAGTTTLNEVLGKGLLLSEGDLWRRQRRLVQPAFHHERIARYCEFFTQSSWQFTCQRQAGQVRDTHADMQQLTLRNVAWALFEVSVDQDFETVREALGTILRRFDQHWLGLLPARLLKPLERRYREASATLEQLVYRYIHERRQSGSTGQDLLSMLLQARDTDDAEMTDPQVRDEILTLLMAGHETTASSLSFIWYLLSQHPEVEARLHTELDSVLGGHLPSLSDLPRLPYLDSVIQESLRLYPPAFALLDRYPLEDVTLAGCRVPAGSEVQVWPWVQHRDPRFWEEPDQFKPERWSSGLLKRLPRFAYYPFGGGTRLCIGTRFAQVEIALVVATLAQHYRLVALPGQAQLRLHASLTLRPKDRLLLRYVSRHSHA